MLIGLFIEPSHFHISTGATADVRFGSKADIEARLLDVRFTPKSGHRNRPAYYLRRSNSGSLAMSAAIRRASSRVSRLSVGVSNPECRKKHL